MKIIITALCILILIFCFLSSCHYDSISIPHTIKSRDNSATTLISIRNKNRFRLPPEGPDVIERWAKIEIIVKDKIVYRSEYEEIGKYNEWGYLDLRWSPDSTKVAYRIGRNFFIIDINGQREAFNVASDYVVTSFKWINNNEILFILKKPEGKNAIYFSRECKGLKLIKLSLSDRKKTELFCNGEIKSSMRYNQVGCQTEEISLDNSKMIFNNGRNISIYDIKTNKIILSYKINTPDTIIVNGFWWYDNCNILIAYWEPENRGYDKYIKWNITTGIVEDQTDKLSPRDMNRYSDPDWFR